MRVEVRIKVENDPDKDLIGHKKSDTIINAIRDSLNKIIHLESVGFKGDYITYTYYDGKD